MNLTHAIRAIKEWLLAKVWDDQIQSHSEAGLLDNLMDEAREDLREGHTTEL